MSRELEVVKKDLEQFIKENPLMAIAIAAGFGYLIARLLNRKKD